MVKGPTPLTNKRNVHKRTKGFLRFQSDMFPRMAVSREPVLRSQLRAPMKQQNPAHLNV